MSTFDGLVAEFPNIRIDYFRNHTEIPTPAACFLSHTHSDHLLGLETLKSPFVYCSAATRRLLLRMEKYPHRINFTKGVLEARKQTFKHLKTILRPLPLNSPVELELSPKSRIRVTLFDANHCPGAVMFLIEGDGKAILYTGDVRAEPWWVNALARQPSLVPFTHGQKRRNLDCIYLDTTFASHDDVHRSFPTKAEGLAELTHKLSEFVDANSVFYFRAWTLGYEDVWILLSAMLKSQVHVDEYQLRLFRNIAEDGLGAEPGPVLSGYKVGNAEQAGCLTTDCCVKIHSCEPGTPCHARIKKEKDVVWITPIISRMEDGTEIAEIGAGGGRGDLYKHHDGINLGDRSMLEALRLLIGGLEQEPATLKAFDDKLSRMQSGEQVTLEELNLDSAAEITLRDFVKALANKRDNGVTNSKSLGPSNVIHFPYSRHSSYEELRHLVGIFRPNDICPCTVDVDLWEEGQLSMESLFGDLCSGEDFKYDKDVAQEIERRRVVSNSKTLDTDKNGEETQSQVSEEGEPDLQRILQGHVVEETACPAQEAALPQSVQTIEVVKDLSLKSNKEAMQRMWRAQNAGSDVYDPSLKVPRLADVQQNISQAGVDGFDLDANLGELLHRRSIIRVDGEDEDTVMDEADSQDDAPQRTAAFEAAVMCMETGDDTLWSNIKMQSLRRGYHTEKEVEL